MTISRTRSARQRRGSALTLSLITVTTVAMLGAAVVSVTASGTQLDTLSSDRMRALYTARLQRHLSTAEATRAASVELIQQLRAQGASTHPYGWGAFVAVGDWR